MTAPPTDLRDLQKATSAEVRRVSAALVLAKVDELLAGQLYEDGRHMHELADFLDEVIKGCEARRRVVDPYNHEARDE